ncbi:hypothetical protein L1987_24243 [Smallanthus sonchifolius]|uniref:Uncharacterized protein n=1 Tax=Smallanthus sonchifolius TaxID=185202 RepID=A0ACB9IK44_9ASTR|nr:hypothetical protein L1987_24243 [Smallanthus sonchifolius]
MRKSLCKNSSILLSIHLWQMFCSVSDKHGFLCLIEGDGIHISSSNLSRRIEDEIRLEECDGFQRWWSHYTWKTMKTIHEVSQISLLDQEETQDSEFRIKGFQFEAEKAAVFSAVLVVKLAMAKIESQI